MFKTGPRLKAGVTNNKPQSNNKNLFMRIGIDIRSLMDEPRSGVGEYTYNFLHLILEQQTDDVFVLFFSGHKIPQSVLDLQKELKDNSRVEFFHFKYPNKIINFLWWAGLGPKIDKVIGVDVLWMPHFNFAKFSQQVKLSITCHDVSFIYFKHLYSLKGQLWHKFVRPMNLYRSADAIFSVSERTASDLVALGIERSKIEIIYPIVNIDPSSESWEVIQSKYELPEEFFLYIGTLDPRKNILSLLEGYKQYKQAEKDPIKLVIGGRLGWNSRRYYKQIFSYINNDLDIYYLGYVPESHKSALYSHAEAFLFPSLYEGFGFPPIEAMSNNCPVIASSTGSLPEVVLGAAYYIDPYDVALQVLAFANMHHNSGLKTTMIEKGNSVVDYWKQRQYVSVEKLLKVMKEL